MTPSENGPVIYWDTSAILSVLFTDRHSEAAFGWTKEDGIHLLSTLTYAETCAVIARFKRERLLAENLIAAAFEAVHHGPWRRLNAVPHPETTQSLSVKWPLRGADLWHLATAKGLQADLPELFLLTYDVRLQEAAAGEGLSHGPHGAVQPTG